MQFGPRQLGRAHGPHHTRIAAAVNVHFCAGQVVACSGPWMYLLTRLDHRFGNTEKPSIKK
jgi:hypothetical protein